MPAVAVDGRGDQIVVWSNLSEGTETEFQVMAATRQAGARGWGAPEEAVWVG